MASINNKGTFDLSNMNGSRYEEEMDTILESFPRFPLNPKFRIVDPKQDPNHPDNYYTLTYKLDNCPSVLGVYGSKDVYLLGVIVGQTVYTLKEYDVPASIIPYQQCDLQFSGNYSYLADDKILNYSKEYLIHAMRILSKGFDPSKQKMTSSYKQALLQLVTISSESLRFQEIKEHVSKGFDTEYYQSHPLTAKHKALTENWGNLSDAIWENKPEISIDVKGESVTIKRDEMPGVISLINTKKRDKELLFELQKKQLDGKKRHPPKSKGSPGQSVTIERVAMPGFISLISTMRRDKLYELQKKPMDDIKENPSKSVALVTMNEALMWTDGRYFLQAEQQLKDGWKLMRLMEDPNMDVWMADNSAEMNGLKKAHIRDGAVVQYLLWLDKQMQDNYGASGYFKEAKSTSNKPLKDNINLTEVSASDKLEEFRASKEHFKGLSFPTISLVGANWANIRYTPDAKTRAELDPNKMYLWDSGSQYLDGTTDITRTVHFGKPSAHEKACYTAVFKGHVALGNARFPCGTMGPTLDILARLPLWKVGLDCRHGTGHGVGIFLNIHEGPHGFSYRPPPRNVPLQASMTVTDDYLQSTSIRGNVVPWRPYEKCSLQSTSIRGNGVLWRPYEKGSLQSTSIRGTFVPWRPYEKFGNQFGVLGSGILRHLGFGMKRQERPVTTFAIPSPRSLIRLIKYIK